MLYYVNMSELTKAEENFLQAIKIREELFGPAHSQLQYDYDALVDLYGKTGDSAKKREYEEKKEEWKKLQNKDNERKRKRKEEEEEDNERKRKRKDEEEEKKMNFQEIINFVTKN